MRELGELCLAVHFAERRDFVDNKAQNSPLASCRIFGHVVRTRFCNRGATPNADENSARKVLASLQSVLTGHLPDVSTQALASNSQPFSLILKRPCVSAGASTQFCCAGGFALSKVPPGSTPNKREIRIFAFDRAERPRTAARACRDGSMHVGVATGLGERAWPYRKP